MSNLQKISEVIWKPVIGFPDYLISNTGLVKSLYRVVLKKDYTGKIQYKTVRERILKQHKRNGYFFVTLRKEGAHKSNNIHHLVAAAFIGIKPNGFIVLHADENKENNNSSNLSYGTRAKNCNDYFKSIGKSKGCINYKDIPSIIERINKGEQIGKLATEYNVGRNDISVIGRIINY